MFQKYGSCLMSWYVYIVVFVAIILVEAYMLVVLWRIFIVSNARRIELEYPEISNGLRNNDNSLFVCAHGPSGESDTNYDAARNRVAPKAE